MPLSLHKHIDAGMEEDLDSNDDHMMSDLLGPKQLDFEVIDFDQFGAQPLDLPLNDILMNVNHHGGISSFKRTSASTKANKKPERHAHSGFEQGGLKIFYFLSPQGLVIALGKALCSLIKLTCFNQLGLIVGVDWKIAIR